MKRSTKQLLSMLLAIVMVIGLAVPAMAARPMGGDAVETPAGEAAPQVGHSGKTAQPVAELTAAGDKKTLNASEMTEFTNSGDQQKTDGATEVVDSFFTIHYGAKDKCDANKKTFDDGFAGTKRLNFGATTNFEAATDYIEFTTTEPTLVKLWWVANKKDRPTAIYKSTDTATAVWSSGDPGEDNKLMMSSKYLADSATYYIGFPGSGGNYIFKIEAISVAAEPTTTNAALGKPSITVAANAETAGTYDVTVTGVAIGKVEDASYNVTQNAEKVVVSAYKDAAAEAAASVTITKYTEASGSNVASFALNTLGSGSYTFKAVASQGETTSESEISEAVSYTLPLATPALTAKAGDGQVTLSWAAVAEATSYEIYQGETKLNVEATEAGGVYTAVVTGLTNDQEYSFTVKAIRGAGGEGNETTSAAATATPVAAPVGGPTVVTKYSLKAADVLPTAADNSPVTTSDLTAVTTVSVDGAAATTGARYFGITLKEYSDSGTTKMGDLLKKGTNKTDGLQIQKQGSASVDFTVKGTADVTVTVSSTGGNNQSVMALVDDSGNVVTGGTMTTASKNNDGDHTSFVATGTDDSSKLKDSFTVVPGVIVVFGTGTGSVVEYSDLPAGTYHIVSYEGFTTRAGRLLAVKVADTYMDTGDVEENIVDWNVNDICGTPTYTTTTDNTKGTITVRVVGPRVGAEDAGSVINIYADKLSIVMYNSAGVEMSVEDDNADGDTHSGTFTPSVTGKYSFKVRVSRAGEEDLLSAASETVDFVLPLATPSISSASSNGAEAGATTAGVTVMWASVAEASSYNLYVKEHSASEWGNAISVPASDSSNVSYVVPDLTIGTEYDFEVEAVRADTTIDGVTVTGSTSAKSDPISATVTANKQIAWVEKTFGTSATDQNNRVVASDNTISFTGLGNEVVKAENGTYTLTVPEDNKQMTATSRTIENLTGDLNTDPEGRVLLSSWNGAGKIKEGEGADGLLFYYTAIPAGTNYTLTADAEVLRWATRDTQNGFGLSAMDRVADKSWTGSTSSNAGNFWNNVYYAGAVRGSFSYDSKTGATYSNKDAGYDSATKYSYYMGPYAVVKTGIPMTANGPYDSSAAPANYYERRFPLDTRLAGDGRSAKFEGNTNRFNLIGNYVVAPKGYHSTYDSGSGWLSGYELTKVKIQLQKNNTGYISTIWDETGNTMLGQNIEYFVTGAMDLSGDKPYHDDDVSGRKDIPALKQCLDSDYEYVGMFTSRDIDVLFSNVKLTTVDPAEDDPAVEPPYTTIIPTMSISSGDSSNSADFTLSVTASVEGTVSVKQKGVLLPETYEIKYNASGETERLDIPVTLATGSNTFEVTFTPDPNQDLPPYTKLENTSPITKSSVVTYNPNYKYLQNIYVAPSPKGSDTGYGTKSQPLDIYTAVKVVSPGQNIVLMEGVYNLQKGISIGRGMSGSDGTVTLQIAELDENGDPVVDEETGAIVTKDYVKDARIYMLADVDENGDPVKVVLNGQRKYSVLTQGASYWVFKDFEVVGSSGTGFQVAGNYNLVQNVKLHDNLSTGLQISRLSNGDRIPDRNGAEPSIDGDKLITDWGDWPCHNIILNCESYRNYDSGYGGADGFGAKETCGEGNIFDGCAAYWNSDDGWDLYAKTEPDKGPLGRVTIKNSVAFENGYEVRKLDASGAATYDAYGNAEMNYDADGKIVKVAAGNGNGFKMGGSHLPGAHSITNSFAFYNLAKGFDSNNGPDIKVHGSTAYNNAQENVGLSSKFSTLNYEVDTTVSFKDDKCPTNPNVEAGKSGPTMADETPTGGTSTYNYYKWDGKVSKGVGTVSGNITAANFVSLDFDNTKWVNGAVRDASGALDLGDFLKLKEDVGAGADQEKVEPETPAKTPENVTNPPQEGPSKDRPVGGGSGNGGTIADAIENAGKTDENEQTEAAFNANKTTDSAGNTEIVVKDETGETVADVKIPATIPDSDVVFEDAVGHWAEDAIEDMAALGIVNGIGDNTYGVDSDVTRGALATMLFRLANGKLGIGNTFDDVASGEWYTDAIGWAVKVGVVTGYPDDTFKPGDSITREQLATMLARFAKLVGLDVSADSSDLAGYKDVSDVDSWATDGMAWCVKNGVINGVSADSLSPDTSATRAQTATMLSRFIDLLK